MTDDRRALIELMQKAADIDLVCAVPAFATDCMMDAEAGTETAAAKGARTPLRENQRNGYRARVWTPGRGGSSWRSRSCARTATPGVSWSRAAPTKRRWWR